MSQFFTNSTASAGFVVGPGSAVSGDFASFSGTTGKIIADSGFSPSSFLQTSNQTITQFDVLVGGATNNIVSVGPGVSGQLFQSKGNALNPAYTTAVYPSVSTINQLLYSSAANTITGLATANNGVLFTSGTGVPSIGTAPVVAGGTGNTTFTPYALITAGTTATGPFQNVASVGTAGQILTSNGASAVPSFQAASASFAPNSTIMLYDEFVGGDSGGIMLGQLAWIMGLAGSDAVFEGAASLDSGHPGLIGNGSLTTGDCTLFLGELGATQVILKTFILGGGAIQMNWVIKVVNLSTGTNTYTLRLGMGDTSNADQVNGCYAEYSSGENSGQWIYKTATASTRTATNSAVAVTAAYHNIGMTINAAATSVSFTVDGVSLGAAITTNIPITGITPFLDIVQSAGTIATNSILIDLFYMTQTLTTAR